jgi:hypothetical protein
MTHAVGRGDGFRYVAFFLKEQSVGSSGGRRIGTRYGVGAGLPRAGLGSTWSDGVIAVGGH